MAPPARRKLGSAASRTPQAVTPRGSGEPAITFRAYRPEDLPACERIAGSSPDFAHAIDTNADAIEVATAGSEVIGFAHMQVWSWNRVAWLGDVLVAADYRNRGIGKALTRRMEQRAREFGCLVLMDHPPANHRAVQFYLSQGFRICGYNDRFYPGSEETTALFVCKELTE